MFLHDNMSKKLILLLILFTSITFNPPLFSEETSLLPEKTEAIREQIKWLQAESEPEVSIATRHDTPVTKAPSIVTVITAEEIKHLGFRTFVEILRIVPGFEILKDGSFGGSFPAVRGIDAANKVRVMLNGHLVNSPSNGEAFSTFDDFPVENIKKIEIIRGPGSAVYGENAFSALINIITFDAKDIDGVRLSSGYGSFDTYDENIVFGTTYENVAISGMTHYKQTAGFNGVVQKDTLSPAPFSKAPGKVHDGRQEYDLNLKVTYKDFYVEGLYINKNKGPFIGPQYALNDESDIEGNYVFGDFGYKKTFEEKFTFRPRVYYDQFDDNLFIESFPENTTLPFDINGDGNNFNPITLAPLASIENFSDTLPFTKEATRRTSSFYAQDIWDITDTVDLTLGVRHDRYNDFGEATSPRMGITWAFIKDASFKVLYGEAFRAPSFVEMFTTNQPVIRGNDDLSPERIKTYEVGLSYKFNKYVASSVNYFYNDISDLIALRALESNQNTFRYENFGDAHVQGIETETKVNISKGNYLFMNYTFQNPEDNHGDDLPSVAQHNGNFGVNVHYWKYMNTNLSAFVSGRRSRSEGDSRDDLPAYALLNLSFIGKEFFQTMEVQGTIFNLLDKDYRDPGP
ncbi:MAG: TonB-dependent receptor, partial [Planctomycetes bacterium]|nr:TonB-dependent receptor [Planctomycetota bacterium]